MSYLLQMAIGNYNLREMLTELKNKGELKASTAWLTEATADKIAADGFPLTLLHTNERLGDISMERIVHIPIPQLCKVKNIGQCPEPVIQILTAIALENEFDWPLEKE